ncbi:MAG: SCO family protein [Myxococcota bacterium]
MPSFVSRTPRWLPFAIAAVTALLLGGFTWVSLRAVPPAAPSVGEAVTLLRVPLPIPDFELTDHRGAIFDAGRLRGRWSFLFFGYTFCPSICPNTLGTLRTVNELLEASEEALADVQFVFVSVDPERDTPERLAQFVPYFHPDFIGATGRPEELEHLAKALGIYHARSDETPVDARDYLVDHTSAILLVDPRAQLHAVYSHPDEPEAIARSFEKIRRLDEERG